MSKISNNILKTSIIPDTCRERYLALDSPAASPLRSLGIHFSGVSNLKKGYLIGLPDPMPSHMVIFTVRGEGFLMTREKKYNLSPDSLIAVPQGSSCMFGVKDDHWDILWFYMKGLPRWETLAKRGVSLEDTDMLGRLEATMEGFLAESPGTTGISPPWTNEAAAHFASLVSIYLDRALNVSFGVAASEERDKMDRLWSAVRDTPGRKWTNKVLADLMNVSTSTMRRLTLEFHGTTPHKMLMDIRMAQARILLSETNYPIKLISSRLGYADEFVFSNAFRHKFGCPPTLARKAKASSQADQRH